MVQRLRYFLGLTEPTPQPSHTSSKGETFRDAYDRGARFQNFQPSDLDPGFSAGLLALCEADQNLQSVSLLWMTEKDLPRKLVAGLRVDNPDEHLLNKFVDRANALGGPRFVAAVADPHAQPEDCDGRKIFYRRGGGRAMS
jgi:hypothetical protein